jgi:hypothetical protein
MARYARNGEVSLAYDVFGAGARDILVTSGWVGSFQSAWEYPAHARWLERMVEDLVAASGFDFEDRGEHQLNGVPGPWRLYSVGPA